MEEALNTSFHALEIANASSAGDVTFVNISSLLVSSMKIIKAMLEC